MAADYIFSFTTAVGGCRARGHHDHACKRRTNVAVDSNIVINFSESVTATASAFCDSMPGGLAADLHAEQLARQLVHADPIVALPVQYDLHGDR